MFEQRSSSTFLNSSNLIFEIKSLLIRHFRPRTDELSAKANGTAAILTDEEVDN